MPGGIQFNANGIVMTKRGRSFVRSDGTCAGCNCDNPPGSGRNFGFCNNCPDNQGPASIIVSISGVSWADGTHLYPCRQHAISFLNPNPREVVVTPLGSDFCLTGPSYFTNPCIDPTGAYLCGWTTTAANPIAKFKIPSWSSSIEGLMSMQIVKWSDRRTWSMEIHGSYNVVGSEYLFPWAWWSTFDAPEDCSTPFTMHNSFTGPDCVNGCGGVDPGAYDYIIGWSGTAVCTPRFALCP